MIFPALVIVLTASSAVSVQEPEWSRWETSSELDYQSNRTSDRIWSVTTREQHHKSSRSFSFVCYDRQSIDPHFRSNDGNDWDRGGRVAMQVRVDGGEPIQGLAEHHFAARGYINLMGRQTVPSVVRALTFAQSAIEVMNMRGHEMTIDNLDGMVTGIEWVASNCNVDDRVYYPSTHSDNAHEVPRRYGSIFFEGNRWEEWRYGGERSSRPGARLSIRGRGAARGPFRDAFGITLRCNHPDEVDFVEFVGLASAGRPRRVHIEVGVDGAGQALFEAHPRPPRRVHDPELRVRAEERLNGSSNVSRVYDLLRAAHERIDFRIAGDVLVSVPVDGRMHDGLDYLRENCPYLE
jgi:hypothetical protein